MTTLRPCPFCSQPAKLVKPWLGGAYVKCTFCAARTMKPSPLSEYGAVYDWNNRYWDKLSSLPPDRLQALLANERAFGNSNVFPLPCPFCGSCVHVTKARHLLLGSSLVIKCVRCRCQMDTGVAHRMSANSYWNSRCHSGQPDNDDKPVC